MQTSDVTDLPFDDRFGMLVDAEVAARDSRQLQGRLRAAQLRQSACIEDLDFEHLKKIVLVEGGRPENGRGQADFADMFFDFPLALPDGDALSQEG